ncbi:MAG TPA: hypothetical protein PKA16_04230 [Ottowia sp.]|uniref:hypothetical protein n=1 Tax=Ottowia sp. TaxID=1898956 RepID=UPI002CDA8B83|nr:hypothetical protein [Ottowia sp.]HMN20583.1 hypothetical protein [Ottowia sp.]
MNDAQALMLSTAAIERHCQQRQAEALATMTAATAPDAFHDATGRFSDTVTAGHAVREFRAVVDAAGDKGGEVLS